MRLLTLENWPVLVICAGMLAAAIIDWWKFKVPNKLTFPLILSGWLLGLANDLGLDAGAGGIGAALVGTFLGFLLLLPIYSVGGMGAGNVKMTMGFGAWIGAFYGSQDGPWIIVCALRRRRRRWGNCPGDDRRARPLPRERPACARDSRGSVQAFEPHAGVEQGQCAAAALAPAAVRGAAVHRLSGVFDLHVWPVNACAWAAAPRAAPAQHGQSARPLQAVGPARAQKFKLPASAGRK